MRLTGALLTPMFGSPSPWAGLSLLELAADSGAENLGELLGLLMVKGSRSNGRYIRRSSR